MTSNCAASRQVQLDQAHVVRKGVADVRVLPERHGAGRHEARRCLGVAAGKERYLVSESDELLGQVRHDAFGATVEARWNAFVERRHLGDSHLL